MSEKGQDFAREYYRMDDEDVVVCPGCKQPMAFRSGHFWCPLCDRSLTVKQGTKQRNRRQSPKSQKLKALFRDGKVTL